MAQPTTGTAAEQNGGTSEAARLLESLVQEAERVSASDIHLQRRADVTEIAFRLDGVMTPVRNLEGHISERLLGRIKFLARLKTYQDALPQDGRIDKGLVSSQRDIRVATYPTVTGEKAVLRLFNSSEIIRLDKLGFPPDVVSELKSFLASTSGLLLLTGPAGSGKTTTIYSCLSHLQESGGRHIITVEDPAEQVLPGIMQTEVNEPLGLDYARATRHLLRQDPQILVIGEIRDEETAKIALRAALTGHLIITTLHAGSCQGVFDRLIGLSGDALAVSNAVEMVLNQRLLRKVCVRCNGQGCPACLSTGFHGRLPVVEWVRLTTSDRQRIAQRQVESVRPAVTLRQAALSLVQSGTTKESEVVRVIGPG